MRLQEGKKKYRLKSFIKFLMVQLLTNLFLIAYVFVKSQFFREVCFMSKNCTIKCHFTTKVFFLIFYFSWRLSFELNIFYNLVFFNNNLKRCWKLLCLMFLIYSLMLSVWILFLSNFIQASNILISLDLSFFVVSVCIFTPILTKFFKLSIKIIWKINKLNLCVILLFVSFLFFGSFMSDLQNFFYYNIDNGKDYFQIFISCFCFLYESLTKIFISKIIQGLKKKNLTVLHNFYLKLLAQGLFAFTNSVQLVVISLSGLSKWALYFQFILIIYSNANLLTNQFISKKFLKMKFYCFCKIIEKMMRKKPTNFTKVEDETIIIFFSQKIVSLSVFIPRIICLLTLKVFSTPLQMYSLENCYGEFQNNEVYLTNIYPIIIYFSLEIFLILLFYHIFPYQMKRKILKHIFKGNENFVKTFYFMSFHCIYESFLTTIMVLKKTI